MANLWFGRGISPLGKLVAGAAILIGLSGANSPATRRLDSPPSTGQARNIGSETPSLVGQLLIASAEIQDPRFAHAVILIVRQDENGGFGIIINRPVGERPIASLLKAAGQADIAGVRGTIDVFAGGPVKPTAGFVVHSADYRDVGTIPIDGHVAVTARLQILRDIGSGTGPAKRFVALGYTGWGAGQLEAEIAHHDWFTTPEDPTLIFDEDRASLWERALARRVHEL